MSVVDIKNFASSFGDLTVYQKSYAVSLDLHKVSKSFPKEEQFSLTSQSRRASKSICANIAEGFVKQSQSKAEFSRFLSIAIGSAGEMLVWISYMKDLKYIDDTQCQRWEIEYESIIKMLNKLRNNL